MPQVCIVSNCKNKSQDVERKCNFFRFPSDPIEREKWLDAIGPNLRKVKSRQGVMYICNEHFEEDCFNQENIKIRENGIVMSLPRKRQRLIPGAVPTIFHQENTYPETIIDVVEEKVILPPLKSPKTTDQQENRFIIFVREPEEINDAMLKNDSVNSTKLSNSDSINQRMTEINSIPEEYSIKKLIENWKFNYPDNVPRDWGIIETNAGPSFIYVHHLTSDPIQDVICSLLVRKDMSVEVKIGSRIARYPVASKIEKFQDLLLAMEKISCLHVCEGPNCIDGFYIRTPKSSSNLCKPCQRENRREKESKRRKEKRRLQKIARDRKVTKNLRQKLRRTLDKISELENKWLSIMKESVDNCHPSTITNNSEALPCNDNWILKSLLSRTNNQKADLQLKNHAVLPLPTLQTLNHYLQNLKSSHGFDPTSFETLEKKVAVMKPEERRGVLVLAQISVSERVYFDSETLTVERFSDLEKSTPESESKERADCALVFLFKPFCDEWVQNVASFLIKESASEQILSHLVTESVTLLENAGLRVDVVKTTGNQELSSLCKKLILNQTRLRFHIVE